MAPTSAEKGESESTQRRSLKQGGEQGPPEQRPLEFGPGGEAGATLGGSVPGSFRGPRREG